MDDRFSRMESALHQLMAATVQRQQDLVQLPKAVRKPVPEFQPHSTRPHGFPLWIGRSRADTIGPHPPYIGREG
jgi:hypothetical protein